MKRDNTIWRPVTAAAVQWRDDGVPPLSTRFDDVYYSPHNGLEESRYIFVQGNELPQRWRTGNGATFCIAETGFGTGLNFLLTWQTWRALEAPRPRLHYISVEKYPLTRDDLTRALDTWPELAPLAGELLAHYPGLVPGQHRLLLQGGSVCLDLWWEDVSDALEDLCGRGQALVDAWYLDGFTPSRNESMWAQPLYKAMASLSRPEASFATFTAASDVRRGLTSAGFQVEKVPGYGGKRESLRGRLLAPEMAPAVVADTPWDLPAATAQSPEHVIVIGAGLAGCATAAALARRGIAVTLLERGRMAGAGSGNEQGILYTRLSKRHSALTDFALQSFVFASAHYRALFAGGALTEHMDGSLCGSFHQSSKQEEMAALSCTLAAVPELARVMDASEAGDVLGLDQLSAGYWFPGSGWLRPAAVCQAVSNHQKIEIVEHCGDIELLHKNGQWHALAGGTVLAEAPCAVIATGTASASMAQLNWLPLQAIRGQTTQLPTHPAFSSLRSALCHSGYIAPAREGEHCIGATFVLNDADTSLRESEHRSNLDKLASAAPGWAHLLEALDPAGLRGRVAHRCASPDYLPMVGPVPDRAGFLHNYADLRKNARQTIDNRGDYVPGLFVSTAHGSRGLTSTPLAAELLASQICSEPPPLDRELCRALAPARFIIRDLGRNRI